MGRYLELGSRIGIRITLYKPPPHVMCHSFHTSQMTGTHQEQLIDHLRVLLFFIELNLFLYVVISRHKRQQKPAPAQPASPSPHHPEGEGSHRIHGSCPGYCKERRGVTTEHFCTHWSLLTYQARETLPGWKQHFFESGTLGLPPPEPFGPGGQIYTASCWETMPLPLCLGWSSLTIDDNWPEKRE